jgi:hypothetical protein
MNFPQLTDDEAEPRPVIPSSSHEVHVEAMALDGPFQELQPPRRKRLLICIAGIEIFLAPINMVSGSMANHGEDWKSVFVGYLPLQPNFHKA